MKRRSGKSHLHRIVRDERRGLASAGRGEQYPLENGQIGTYKRNLIALR